MGASVLCISLLATACDGSNTCRCCCASSHLCGGQQRGVPAPDTLDITAPVALGALTASNSSTDSYFRSIVGYEWRWHADLPLQHPGLAGGFDEQGSAGARRLNKGRVEQGDEL